MEDDPDPSEGQNEAMASCDDDAIGQAEARGHPGRSCARDHKQQQQQQQQLLRVGRLILLFEEIGVAGREGKGKEEAKRKKQGTHEHSSSSNGSE